MLGSKAPTAAPIPDTILSEADDEDEQSGDEGESVEDRAHNERGPKG